MKTRLFLVLIVATLCGCTVLPKPVQSTHASIGATGRADSDIIGVAPNGAGYFVRQPLVDDYNGLAIRFSNDPFFPRPLVPGEGITVVDGKLLMDRPTFRRLLLLQEWRRSGKIPVAKPTLLQRILMIEFRPTIWRTPLFRVTPALRPEPEGAKC